MQWSWAVCLRDWAPTVFVVFVFVSALFFFFFYRKMKMDGPCLDLFGS